MPFAVRIDNLTFSWRKAGEPDLKIDSLTLDAGEQVLISGPSGSGKTSLLNLLSGITLADTGTVEILGQDMSALSAPARDAFRADRIGMIFQIFNLLPYLSVLENIALAGTFSSRRRREARDVNAQARDLLAALGLSPDDVALRTVDTLSIGQQQRVATARALIGNPGLVIADEPTSALDAANRDAFIDLVTSVCRVRGATLIVVSHDEALIDHFDRRIRMSDINTAMNPQAIA